MVDTTDTCESCGAVVPVDTLTESVTHYRRATYYDPAEYDTELHCLDCHRTDDDEQAAIDDWADRENDARRNGDDDNDD